MQSENITTHFSWSRALVAHLRNRRDSTIDGEEASQLFRLLRLGDLSTSMAWHSIWHGLERTP